MSRASNPRNPPCHEAPFARTRNPLCTRNSGAFHAIVPLASLLLSINRFSHDPYLLRSLFITSLFVSSNGYNCKEGITKGWLLVQIGTRIRTLRVIGKGRVKIFIPIDRGHLFFEPHCRLDETLRNTKICTNLDNRDSIILRLSVRFFLKLNYTLKKKKKKEKKTLQASLSKNPVETLSSPLSGSSSACDKHDAHERIT